MKEYEAMVEFIDTMNKDMRRETITRLLKFYIEEGQKKKRNEANINIATTLEEPPQLFKTPQKKQKSYKKKRYAKQGKTWTLKDEQIMASLFADGSSHSEISRFLERNTKSIKTRWYFIRHGLVRTVKLPNGENMRTTEHPNTLSTKNNNVQHQPTYEPPVKKTSRVYQSYTPEEDKIILQGLKNRWSSTMIQRVLSSSGFERQQGSVASRMRILKMKLLKEDVYGDEEN